MNYAQLKAAIQSYTENYETEFESYIPTFVQQTEERVYNTVQLPPLRSNKTGILTTGNKYLPCPLDFMSVFSLAVIENYGTATETYTFLLNKDVNFIRESYPTPADTGLPEYYALFGPAIVGSAITNELTFILGPTPNSAYTAELHFYYYPESITTAGSSWLGDNFDTVLLYGTLVEAYTFMKGETDLLSVYEGKYKEALGLAKRLGDGMERQDAYRSGQYRQAVT